MKSINKIAPIIVLPLGRWRTLVGVYFFMQHYKINSPSGKRYQIAAESIYHAVQIAKKIDNFLFTEADYFKINTVKK